MKGIYCCFYLRRSSYLYILQGVCFYFANKKFYCCYSYKSLKTLDFRWKSWKSPRTLMEKVLKSPGIWIFFFWWEPCVFPALKLTQTYCINMNISFLENWEFLNQKLAPYSHTKPEWVTSQFDKIWKEAEFKNSNFSTL